MEYLHPSLPPLFCRAGGPPWWRGLPQARKQSSSTTGQPPVGVLRAFRNLKGGWGNLVTIENKERQGAMFRDQAMDKRLQVLPTYICTAYWKVLVKTET